MDFKRKGVWSEMLMLLRTSRWTQDHYHSSKYVQHQLKTSCTENSELKSPWKIWKWKMKLKNILKQIIMLITFMINVDLKSEGFWLVGLQIILSNFGFFLSYEAIFLYEFYDLMMMMMSFTPSTVFGCFCPLSWSSLLNSLKIRCISI